MLDMRQKKAVTKELKARSLSDNIHLKSVVTSALY